jgi:NO-binding membrane sensor protein with MHYT domain
MNETVNSAVTTTYNMNMVALSFVIAAVGSFVALTVATRIRGADGRINNTNVFSAGLALGGVGVWAMHFIGMLGLNMDVARSYSSIETLISMVAAVAATSLALAYAARNAERIQHLLLAGLMLGLSVVVMHYLGMFGLKTYGYVVWDYSLVALSVVIAVVAATAALWLAFNTRGLGFRFGAAMVMASAVCAMHYTGMYAASFVCTTANRNAIPQGFGYVSSFNLPTLVVVASVMLVVLISVDQFFQAMREPINRRPTTQP